MYGISPIRRAVPIAVAIGADAVTAQAAGGARAERVTLAGEGTGAVGGAGNGTGPGVETLTAAFAAVAERLGIAGRAAQASFVLMPPLCDARLVPLPPLRQAEAEAVLRRDAARHFVNGAYPRAIGVKLPAARRGGTSRGAEGGADAGAGSGTSGGGAGRAAGIAAPALAAAAPVALLEAVHAAAAAVGWRVRSIGPAHAAWLAHAERASRGNGAGSAAVVAVVGGTAYVACAAAGARAARRRVPVAAAAEVVAACGDGGGVATLLGEPAGRARLAEAFVRAGWTVSDTGTSDPAAASATDASHALPALLPPSEYAARAARANRLARRLAAAAVVLLIGAAGVELRGAARALDTLRDRRAAIRADVAPLLAARDSLDRLEARAAAIDGLTGGSPRWTRVLFDVALLLPAESHMTRFVASGDTVEIEAAGARAGQALQALRDAGTLRDVRLLGVVDRELSEGATAVERFRIGARYAPPVAAPAAVAGGGAVHIPAAAARAPGGSR
jgi:hypothetical protein